MDWFRHYHGALFDPKWALVAAEAETSAGTVALVWMALLEHASNHEDRGSIAGFNCRVVDHFFGLPYGTTQDVLRIMSTPELSLIEDNRLVNWEKRQPKREDGSAERARKWREERKAERERTQANATERERTLDKIRVEKKEKKDEYSLRSYSSPELDEPASGPASAAPDDPVILEFPTSGKVKSWALTQSALAKIEDAYPPPLDVLAECRKAKLWIEGSPGNKKTAKGMMRFLSSWMGRAQDRGRGRGNATPPKEVPYCEREPDGMSVEEFESRFGPLTDGLMGAKQ